MSAYLNQQWDESRQCYVPLAFHRCDRCGRAHAKVYEIVVEGRTLKVGAQCMLRLLEETQADNQVLSAPPRQPVALPVRPTRYPPARRPAQLRAPAKTKQRGGGFWSNFLIGMLCGGR